MLSMSIFVSCSSGATTCNCAEEEHAATKKVRYSISKLHSASEFFRNSLLSVTPMFSWINCFGLVVKFTAYALL